MSKNIGKNINEILSGKYSQKLLHHAKQSVTHALRTTWKYVIQKIVKATGDLIGNKIANRITNVSQNSQKIIHGQLQMKMIKKYLKRDIYLEEKDKKLLIILILI